MMKETHLTNLREQYISLSRQYLNELQAGKTIQTLKELKFTIETLVKEIDEIEQALEEEKDGTGTVQ